MHDKELEEIAEKLGILEKAFDHMRLVDPVNKQVIELHNNMIENTGLRCFDYWGKNKVCDNCISIRAYRDNKTYIKMEYSVNDIFMITAIPVELSDRVVVLELLRNATNSLILDFDQNDKYSEIYAMIDSMNNLSLKDSLTGVYNRRYINEKLPVDLTNAAISEKNISIIMTDIDFFKKVNDTYGHLAGDCALKYFAKLISGCLTRDYDWVARYGGEEFLICLPSAGQRRAVEIAENMRKKVENSTFECGENKIQFTASFGVCSITPKMGFGMEEVIGYADKKLYEAKHNGRNRVEA